MQGQWQPQPQQPPPHYTQNTPGIAMAPHADVLQQMQQQVSKLERGMKQEQADRDRATKLLNELAPLKKTKALAEQQLQETSELTEDVQQALKQVKDIAANAGVIKDLEADVVDLRGAVESMMDMLEKTLTIKDGNALLDDQEARIDEKMDECLDHMHKLDDDLQSTNSNMETVASDLLQVSTEVTHHGDVTAQKLRDDFGVIHSKLTERTETTASKVQALEKKLEKSEQAWRKQIKALQDDFEQRLKAEANVLKEQLRKTEQDITQTQDRKAEELTKKITLASRDGEDAAKKFNQSKEDLKDQESRLEAKITASFETLEQKVEKASKRAEDAERALGQRCDTAEEGAGALKSEVETVQKKAKELDTKLSTQLEEERKKIMSVEGNYNELKEELGQDVVDLDHNHRELTQFMQDAIKKLDTNTLKAVEELRSQVKDEVETMKSDSLSKLQENVTSLQSQVDFNKGIAVQKEDVGKMLAGLRQEIDKTMEDNATKAEAHLAAARGSLETQLKDQESRLEKQSQTDREEMGTIKIDLHEHKSDTKKELLRVDKELSGAKADLEKSIQEEAKKVDKQSKEFASKATLDECTKPLQHRISGLEKAQTERQSTAERTAKKLEGMINAERKYADDKTSECDRGIKAAAADLKRELDLRLKDIRSKHVDPLEARVLKVEGGVDNVTVVVKTLRSDLDRGFQTAGEDSKKLADFIREIDGNLGSHVGNINGRIEQLVDQINAVKHEADSNLSREIVEIEALMAKAKDDADHKLQSIDAAKDTLSEKIDASISDLHKRDTELDRQMKASYADQNVKFDDKLKAIESQLGDLRKNHGILTADMKSTCADVQKRLESEMKTRTQDTQSHLRGLQTSVEDQKLSTQTETNQLKQLCDRLEKAATQAALASEARTSQLEKEMKSNHEHVTDKCNSLDRKIDTESASRTDQVKDVAKESGDDRRRIEDILNKTAGDLHRKFQVLDAALKQAVTELKAQIGNEERLRETQAGEMQVRADELSAKMDENLNTALKATSTVDSKLTAAQNDSGAHRHQILAKIEKNQAEAASERLRLDEADKNNEHHIDSLRTQANESLAAARKDIETNFQSQIDAHEKLIADERAHFEELLSKAKQPLEARCESLDGTVKSLGRDISENKQSISDLRSQHEEKISRLDAHQTSRIDRTKELLEQQHKQLEEDLRDASAKADEALEVKITDRLKELHGKCSDVEGKVTVLRKDHDARFTKLNDTVELNHSKLDRAHTNMDTKVQGQLSSLEDELTAYHSEFTQEFSKLQRESTLNDEQHDLKLDGLFVTVNDQETKLLEKVQAVQIDLNQKHAAQTARMDDQQEIFRKLIEKQDEYRIAKDKEQDEEIHRMATTATKDKTEFKATISELDAKLVDNAAGWQNDAKQFKENLEKFVSEMHKEQTENAKRIHQVKTRMEEISDNWHEAERKLVVAAQVTKDEITYHLDEKSQLLETELSSVKTEIETKIQTEHNLVLAKYQELEQTTKKIETGVDLIGDHSNKVLSEYKEQMRVAQEATKADLKQHYEQLSETGKLTDARLEQKCVELAAESLEIREHFNEVFLNLEYKFSDKHMLQDEKLSKLQQSAQEHYSEVQGRCVELESRLNSETTAIKDASVENFELLSKNTSELDKTFRQQLENLSGHLTEVCQGLNTEMSAKCAALDDKFTVQAASHEALMTEQFQHLSMATEKADEKVDQTVKELTQSVKDTIANFAELNTSLEEQIKERQTTMETKFNHKNEEQDVRISESENRLDTWNSELETVNNFLTPLEQRVNQHYEYFVQQLETIDSEFLNWRAPMEKQMDEARLAHEEDRSKLSEDIKAATILFAGHWEAADAAQKATDRRVDENNSKTSGVISQLDKTAQQMHAKFTEVCAALDKKIVTQITDAQEDIRSEHEYFTGVCASLDEKFTVATEETKDRVELLSVRVTDDHKQLTDLYDGVDKRFGGIVAKHDTRIGILTSELRDSHASLQALVAKLVDDLKDEATTRAQKLHEEREFCTQTCAKINETYDSKTTELSTNHYELRSLVTQKTQGLSQANEKLEKKLLAEVQRIDTAIENVPETIDNDRQRAAERSDQIETLILNTKTDVEKIVNSDRQMLNDRCDALNANVARLETDLHGDVETIKSDLQTETTRAMGAFKQMHGELNQRLDKQQKTIADNEKSALADNEKLKDGLYAEVQGQMDLMTRLNGNFKKAIEDLKSRLSNQHDDIGKKVSNLSSLVDQHKQQSDSQLVSVDKKIEDEKNAQIHRVDTIAEDIRSKLTEMTIQHNQQIADVQKEHRSVVDKCAADKRELTNISTRIEGKVDSQGEEAQKRLDAQRTDLVAMLTESDHRFQTAVSDHGGMIAKISDHVDANIRRLLTAHAALEKAFSEERTTQATTIEQHKQFFEEMFDTVKLEFNDRAAAEKENVDELVERQHRHFTDTILSLNKKVDNENSAQTTSTAQLNKWMNDQVSKTRTEMSSLDQRLTQAWETQKESIENNNQETKGLMAELDEKYHDVTQRAEAQANQLTNEIGTAFDKQKEFERDLTMLKGKNEAQDERVDGLSILIDQHKTHFDESCAMLDTRLRDAANVSAAEIERAQNEVMQQCMQVDTKLSEEKESTAQRLENHHRHFTQLCNQVDASSESRASAAETRITATLTKMEGYNEMFHDSLDAIDKKLLDSVAAQEVRLRDQNKHFADVCAGLNKKVEDDIREVQAQVSQQCGQIDLQQVEWTKEFQARLDSTTADQTNHHRHFTAVCNKLDMQLGDQTEELKHHLVQTQEHLQEYIDQVERRLGKSQADQEARCDEIGDAIQAQEDQFTAACGRLDSLMTQQVAALEEKVQHEHAHAEELHVKLQTTICDRLDDQNGRIDDVSKTAHEHHRYFTSICEQLDRKFSDAATSQRDQLQEADLKQEAATKQLTEKLTTEMAQSLKSIDVRLSSQHAQFTEVLSKQDDKFSEACVKLNARMLEESRSRDSQAKEDREQFSELCAQTSRAAAEELTKTNTKFTDVCIGLDEKFSKAAGELKETVQSDFSKLEATLTASSTNLKSSMSAEMKALDDRLTDSVIGLHQKTNVLVDEQVSRVTTLQKSLTEEDNKLKQQLNSRAAELETKIAESRDSVSTILMRRAEETDTKVRELEETTSQRASKIERQSKQDVDRLTSALSNAEKKATADLQRDVGILQQKLDVRMGSIEKRQADMKAKAAEDQDALEARTTDEIGRLNTTLGALRAKHEALAEEQTRTSKDTSRRIGDSRTHLDQQLDNQNQLRIALEEQTGRNDKKRKDAIEDVKRSADGRLEAIKAIVEVKLDQRIKSLEEKVRPLEADVTTLQKTSTSLTLTKMDVEEQLKLLESKVTSMEEETEQLEVKLNEQVQEISVDVQLLQAMQQSM